LTAPPGGGPGWAAHEPPEAPREADDDAGWDAAYPYGYPPQDQDLDVRNGQPGSRRPPERPGPAERDDPKGRPRGRHHRYPQDAGDQVQPPPVAPDPGYGYEPPRYQRDWQRDREAYPPSRAPDDWGPQTPSRPQRDAQERRTYPDPLREAMAPPPRPRERPAPPPWPRPDEGGRGGRYEGAGYQGAGYNRTDYDGAGYNRADYDGVGYDRSRYDRAGYPPGPPPGRAADLSLPRGRPPERTRVLPPSMMPTPPSAGGFDADQTGSWSIVRSSGVMAVGTLGSRVTGFLRTIAQSWALGVGGIAAAYNLANTLPNVVYNLALGGILTSVIVPLIVNASKRDADRGAGYDQRMFTLITAALLGITVVATAIAAPLAHLYSGTSVARYPGAEHLTVIFAYFFIPQIFFYGVSSLIGAVLNSRGSFAAPMWTPIVNNFVVIGILGLYVAVAGLHRLPVTISSGDVRLLGFGTTVGIIAQTVALIPALRRVGFRWHPRFDFRRSEAREIGRMGGWMFAYVAATQVAFLVTTKLAGDGNIQGVTDYNYAWLLFQLPYAVVGISVITALLPRMSAHASEGRLSLVRDDFSSGVRLSSAIVVPCSLVLAVLGPDIAEVFLGLGATKIAEAHYIGVVFAVFCLGLLPFMIFQLQLRVFYSLHDSKTPALIGFATTALNIIANIVALNVLPANELVAGLGVGFGLANVLGSIVAWQILSRRIGGLDGRRIGSTLARMHAASVPAALMAIFVGMVIATFMTGSRSVAFANIVIGGGAALLLYLLFARALQVTELTNVTRSIRSRLGR
jgi:putative peptidoglycan lipid II flippase